MFPPSPGIGGRRWVKFAKYLIRDNYDIRVISAKSKFKNSLSNWNSDLQEIKHLVDYIPSGYPFYLGINPYEVKRLRNYNLRTSIRHITTEQ